MNNNKEKNDKKDKKDDSFGFGGQNVF